MHTNAINDTGVKYLYDKLHGEIEPIAEAVSDSEVTIEGNPLSFNTLSSQNAKSTILSLEPIQDLHGYDYPWVGGAGKNKLPMSVDGIKDINTSGTWSGNTYTFRGVTYKILTDTDNNVTGIKTNGTATGNAQFNIKQAIGLTSGDYIINGAISSNKRMFFYDGTTWYDDYGSGKNFTISSQTTQEVSIVVTNGTTVSNEIFYPMIRLSTVTDASFEPYTNICPITGRTEIGILGEGVNLWDDTNIKYNKALLSVNGDEVDSSASDYLKYTSVIPNSKYKLAWSISSLYSENNRSICFYNSNKAFISGASLSYSPSLTSLLFTVPDNAYYVQIVIDKGTTNHSFKWTNPDLDLTISLGQTVYGGTLDVENGVLVVDRKRINLGSLTWTQASGGISRFQSELISDAKIPSASSEKANCVCSVFESDCTDNVYTTNGKIGIHTNGMVWVSATNIYSDAATFTTAMDGADFAYELATPITINLTPNTIDLLKGVNNISTDGDKITLTYRDGSVATLGDLTSAVDSLDGKIEDSKILTDTATGDKYILVVTNGVLSVEQVSN